MGKRIESFTRGHLMAPEVGVGYASSRSGMRHTVAHQTPASAVTGQTSFVATTPTFLFYKTAAQPRRLILSKWVAMQTGTVAGGPIRFVIGIEETNAYDSGGTAIVPQCPNMAEAPTPGFTFRYNPTAAAADASRRYVFSGGVGEVTGQVDTFDFGDSIMIEGAGSIAIYTYAAATGPSWFVHFEVIEEDE